MAVAGSTCFPGSLCHHKQGAFVTSMLPVTLQHSSMKKWINEIWPPGPLTALSSSPKFGRAYTHPSQSCQLAARGQLLLSRTAYSKMCWEGMARPSGSTAPSGCCYSQLSKLAELIVLLQLLSRLLSLPALCIAFSKRRHGSAIRQLLQQARLSGPGSTCSARPAPWIPKVAHPPQ